MNWKLTATTIGLADVRLGRHRARRRRAQHLQLGQLHQPRADQEVRGRPTRSRSPSPTTIPTTPRSPRCGPAATASTSWCPRPTTCRSGSARGCCWRPGPTRWRISRTSTERWVDVAWDPGRHYSVPWQWGTTGIARQHEGLQGRHQHLGHLLRSAGRAEGQGQRRAGDERRHAPGDLVRRRRAAAPATRRS